MKVQDATLIRARAKAPLIDLKALHLSSAGLTNLRQPLELCTNLQSLYLNSNRLHDIDDISALRYLWRIDLQDNLLGQSLKCLNSDPVRPLKSLSSFSALGFLNLDRNHLLMEHLVCLRDVHLISLSLQGNSGLDTDTISYRSRVIALLPLLWVLDGEFITSQERSEAIEQWDITFVKPLLTQRHSSTLLTTPKQSFGATSESWGCVSFAAEQTPNTIRLLTSLANEPSKERHAELRDRHRLKTLNMFYEQECQLHNSHVSFAPSRLGLDGQLMPRPHLQDLLLMEPKIQLQVAVILAAILENSSASMMLPRSLVSETLTIILLSAETSINANDLVLLPHYMITVIISILRCQALDQEIHNPFALLVWKESLPPVLTSKVLPRDPSQYRAFAIRCAITIFLYSKATSFAIGAKQPALIAMLEVAQCAPLDVLESEGIFLPSPQLNMTVKQVSMPWKSKKASLVRGYRQPWSERSNSSTRSASVPTLTTKGEESYAPKIGDNIEVDPKMYSKIDSISDDGRFITTSSADNSFPPMTLRINQLVRVSRSLWRITDHRFGRLHRESPAFHRHGAARVQGFPNYNLSVSDVASIPTSSNCKSIEVFCAADTLDANYVLASSTIITAQNAVAMRQVQRSPGGLWSRLDHPSAQPVIMVPEVNKATLKYKTTIKPKGMGTLRPPSNHTCKQEQSEIKEEIDEWILLQRDMQVLLGIKPSQQEVENNGETKIVDGQTNSQPHCSLQQQRLSPTKFKPTRALSRIPSWHAVPTKPHVIVGSTTLIPLVNTSFLESTKQESVIDPNLVLPSQLRTSISLPTLQPL